MIRLNIKPIAEAQGLTMYALQQRAGVSMGAVRRYWYSTSDGKSHGRPLRMLHLEQLEAVAAALGVDPGQLLHVVPDQASQM
jgi:transcriptional regulator with XRE-family HTH domain